MRNYLLPRLLLGVLALGPATQLRAAVFNRAEVSRVYNQVTLIDPGSGRRPAVPRDVVAGDVAVQTGLESRAELLFPDKTFTRLASNTIFSFRGGTREMDLKSGAILFQVPPGSGGADIHAAAITAAITGTTGFVERIGGVFKLIVLEGDVRAYLNNRVGESMIVHGGQMLIAPLNSTSVKNWQAVDVDVQKLMKSSALLNARFFRPLPLQAMADVTRVVSNQRSNLTRGSLNRTNLVIDGGVTQVLLVNNDTRNRSDTDPTPPPQSPPIGPRPTPVPDPVVGGPNPPQPLPTPNPFPTPNPNPSPQPSATPGLVTRPDPYVISSGTSIVTRGDRPNITTNGVTNTGRVYRGNSLDGSASRFVFGSTTPFDLRSRFDERFGRNVEPDFAPNGVAVFRFRSLRIVGAPALDANSGPRDLAFIATNSGDKPGITTGGPGGNVDLSGLRSVFLGTVDSSILIDSPISFSATGSTFRYLQLYARGHDSDATLDTRVYLAGDLYIDSERDTILDRGADVVSSRLLLNAARDLHIDGMTNASFTELSAARSLTIDGKMNSTQFFAFAGDAQINGSLTADYVNFQLSGELTTGHSDSKISTVEFVLKANAFELNGDRGSGTTFDLARLARLDLDVGTLTLASDFTLPASVASTLKLGNVDAPSHGLFGFQSIVSTGSGDDRLRDLSVRDFTASNSLIVGRDVTAQTLLVGDKLDIGGQLRPYSTAPSTIHIASAKQIGIGGGINFTGRDATSSSAAGDGLSLLLLADEIVFTTGSDFGIAGANLDGGDRALGVSGSLGGSGGTLDIGNIGRPINGDVTLDAPISATTGQNANPSLYGGSGGSVNVVSNGTIKALSRIQVSDDNGPRRSARGGNVRFTSNRVNGAAIRVASSAQIASLLAAGAPGPGGEIVFRSAGGDIDISGSVTADRGRVDIENTGANGRVALTNATISADVVRARAFGNNGVLTVGGGSISADTTLKLYADGSNGTVLFTSNVNLNGNSTKIITGNTVTISPNVVVRIGGPNPAQVYANNPNYTGFGGNGTSSGTFAGAGATTQPRAASPGY